MTHMESPETAVTDAKEAESEVQPGERLKQARESLGFSREDIATHLHLSVDKIAALERGESEGIAAPVFLAGYLRAYAKKVDLPGEEIVEAYEALGEIETPSIEPRTADYGKMQSNLPSFASTSGLSPWLGWGLLVLVVLGGVALGWRMLGSNTDSSKPLVTSRIESAPTLTGETTLSPPGEDNIAGGEASTDAEVPADVELNTEQAEETPKTLAPRAQLILTFREDSWAEIRDAQGNRLMHRLGRAGEERSVTGVAPFEVVLGFAPGVDLQYNGQVYDLSLYKNRRLVRFTVGKAGDKATQPE
jgi:cytoskeleton protein RodZ